MTNQQLKNSFSKVFSQKKFIVLSLLVLVIVLYLYYFAIEQSSSWRIFLKVNSNWFIFLQIISSIINAALLAIAIPMMIYSIKLKRESNRLGFLQTISSVFFSVITTGCYVCGSVLLPTLGLTASILNLPFQGIEIKLLTAVILMYSIYEYLKVISGYCELERRKRLDMIISEDTKIKLNFRTISQLKGLALMLVLLFAIFVLPALNLRHRTNSPENFCSAERESM